MMRFSKTLLIGLAALLSLLLLAACDGNRAQLYRCNCDGVNQDTEEATCPDFPANNNCVDDHVCTSDEDFVCLDCQASPEEAEHYKVHLYICEDAMENPGTYACSRDRTCGDLVCDSPCENSNNCVSDCQWPLPTDEASTSNAPISTVSSGGTTGGGQTVTAVPDACADRGGTANITDLCVCPGVIDHVVYCGDGTKFDTLTDQSCVPTEPCSGSNTGGEGGAPVDPTVVCGCGLYGAPGTGLGCSNGVIEECNVNQCGCKP